MATSGADIRAEIRCAREKFATVPEVEAVFAKDTHDGVCLCVVVAEKNIAVEERIYDLLADIIAQYPAVNFDFRLLSRRGRLLAAVATLSGYPVFERTA